jgi:hypothetical protein
LQSDIKNKQSNATSDATVPVRGITCFERLYTRECNHCFHKTISSASASAFKQSAYQLTEPPLSYDKPSGQGLVITIAHRGTHHYREQKDPYVLVKYLADKLAASGVGPAGSTSVHQLSNSTTKGVQCELGGSSPSTSTTTPTSSAPVVSVCGIYIQLHDTSKPKGFQEQIELAANSDIIIATHGAFESNVIYMRPGSLFIELRGHQGNYESEGPAFGILARNFLVHHRHVLIDNLREDRQPTYTLSDVELGQVGDFVVNFVKSK